MDPRKLVIVLEVAEQGSVSRAAQSLNVAQPSLS
ncbi:MAG: LysR family transcriptional regulator, partial [Bauldia litoralis]